MHARKVLIIEIINQEGNSYFGECNAFETNWYANETIDTVYHSLKPGLKKKSLERKLLILRQLKLL